MASTPPTDEAPPFDDAPDPGDSRPRVLLVALGAQHAALPAGAVREVTRATPITPLAGAAPWILGVAAVRGNVLPVGDLSRRLDVPSAGDAGWFIVLEDGRRAAAVVGVTAVRVATADEVEEGAGDGASPDSTFAGLPRRGVVRLEGVTGWGDDAPPARVPLIDVAALLDDFFDSDGG